MRAARREGEWWGRRKLSGSSLPALRVPGRSLLQERGPAPASRGRSPPGPGPTCALSTAHGGTNDPGPGPPPPFKPRPARPLGSRRKGRCRARRGVRCSRSWPVLRERGGVRPSASVTGLETGLRLGWERGAKERARAPKPSRGAGHVRGAGAAPPFPSPAQGPAGRGLRAARASPGALRPPSAAGGVKWRRGRRGGGGFVRQVPPPSPEREAGAGVFSVNWVGKGPAWGGGGAGKVAPLDLVGGPGRLLACMSITGDCCYLPRFDRVVRRHFCMNGELKPLLKIKCINESYCTSR